MRASATDKSKLVLVALVLFLLSLFLTAYSAKHPSVGRTGHALVSTVAAPITRTASSAVRFIANTIDEYLLLLSVKEENKRLTSQLKGVSGLYTELEEIQQENSRLRRLLALEQAQGISGVLAEVVGYDPSNWIEAATLNRGSRDGIELAQAVVTAEGVVGQIISVTTSTSKVLFISDRSSGVGAMLQSSRAFGVLRGGGVRSTQLEYLSSDESVESGEFVITSGLDGVYPKGILLGLVASVSAAPNGLFHRITVRPSVDFSRLEEVVVIRKQRGESTLQENAAESEDNGDVTDVRLSENGSESGSASVAHEGPVDAGH